MFFIQRSHDKHEISKPGAKINWPIKLEKVIRFATIEALFFAVRVFFIEGGISK